MRIVFFGTPVFAAEILEELNRSHEIVACVTAPDAKSGRGKKLKPTVVKEKATKLGVEVYQPMKLDDSFFKVFNSFGAHIAIVVAYGRLIPEKYLLLPKHGFINIHASILPRWRGAAPIHRAILSGDKKTGISIMQMDKGLDTGDVHKILECEIEAKETTGSLHDKLIRLGKSGIMEFLAEVEGDKLNPVKQDDEKADYAHKIDKEMSIIDWTLSGAEIERLIRGLNPYPSAKSSLDGTIIKIHDADFIEDEKANNQDEIEENTHVSNSLNVYGTVIESGDDKLKIACKGGYLLVKELQKAGSKKMSTLEFLRGNKIEIGQKLI